MRASAPGVGPRFSRSVRPLVLGAATLLLVLAMACGASEQPQQSQQPGQSAGQASQVEPAQPVAPEQAVAEPATGTQEQAMDKTGEGMAKSEETTKPEAGVQAQPEPMAARETTTETTGEQPASPQIVVQPSAATQPGPVVKAMDPQAQPGTETTQPAAPHQEPAAPTQPTDAAPAPVPASEPVAAPQPTQAPAPQPAATPVPQPTATAVVVDPGPEVGNKEGFRIPELTLELVGGTMVSTSGLIEQAKPTFLFFTSTT